MVVVVRIEPHYLVVVTDGLVRLTLLGIGVPTVVISSGIVRIEPDRFVEVFDRPIVLLLVVVDTAAIAGGCLRAFWCCSLLTPWRAFPPCLAVRQEQ